MQFTSTFLNPIKKFSDTEFWFAAGTIFTSSNPTLIWTRWWNSCRFLPLSKVLTKLSKFSSPLVGKKFFAHSRWDQNLSSSFSSICGRWKNFSHCHRKLWAKFLPPKLEIRLFQMKDWGWFGELTASFLHSWGLIKIKPNCQKSVPRGFICWMWWRVEDTSLETFTKSCMKPEKSLRGVEWKIDEWKRRKYWLTLLFNRRLT